RCPLCAHPTAAEIAASGEARLVRCGACTLAYSDPPPRMDIIHGAYERLYGHDLAVARVAGRRLAVFSDFFERVPPSGQARRLEMLADVKRVLVPGGRVFVRTPNERFQLAAYRLRRRIAWCTPLARLLGDAYYFQPVMWSSATLAAALTRGGFVDVRLWNSRPSAGDPYHVRSPRREAAMHAAKRL